MGFRPMIKIDSTLIEFNSGKSESYKKHLENIEELLERTLSSLIACLLFDINE